MPGRLLDPSEHPRKEIRAVLIRLVKDGWTIRQAGHWELSIAPVNPPVPESLSAGRPGIPAGSAQDRRRSIEVPLGGGRPEAAARVCCRLTTDLSRSMIGEYEYRVGEEVGHGC